jgi:DmsE family decaheme c-type cytochrome
MAWHSSFHFREGVACADCHEAHPNSEIAPVVNVSHTTVARPNVRPMGVADPETCYKCHPKIFALASLPSHHPIREGKLRCGDCHDSHGQDHGSLKALSLNQLCFECHAEKEGPFVWEHAPVTEDCGICHEPHGTVSDDLLRQPATFLCLRCHSGHRSDHRQLDDPDNAVMREALYADCTQCHSQVHGSDLINETLRGRGLSR